MEHSFDVEIAVDCGVHSAILFQNILFWLIKNAANQEHFYDGRYWTYNSRKAFTEIFPYLSEDQIRYAMSKLIDRKYIITGNYNENKMNQTIWYSLGEIGAKYADFPYEHWGILSSPSGNFPKSYNIYTDNKHTDIKENTKKKSETPNTAQYTHDFEMFWESYPKRKSKGDAFKAWKSLNPNEELQDTIIKAIENATRSDQWRKDKGKYIPFPATWLRSEGWNDDTNTNPIPQENDLPF